MKPYIPLIALALLVGCDAATDDDLVSEAPVTEAPAALTPAVEHDEQPDTMAVVAVATGTVESVDPAGGRIVIAHGPVAALNWPAMTMGFRATPEQAQTVKAGDQVEFEFESLGPENTITRISQTQ